MSANNPFIDAILNADAKSSSPRSGAPTVRALAWARVSTDMQEDRGCSIPEQLREMRAYAKRHGVEIAEEFQEAKKL